MDQTLMISIKISWSPGVQVQFPQVRSLRHDRSPWCTLCSSAEHYQWEGEHLFIKPSTETYTFWWKHWNNFKKVNTELLFGEPVKLKKWKQLNNWPFSLPDQHIPWFWFIQLCDQNEKTNQWSRNSFLLKCRHPKLFNATVLDKSRLLPTQVATL